MEKRPHSRVSPPKLAPAFAEHVAQLCARYNELDGEFRRAGLIRDVAATGLQPLKPDVITQFKDNFGSLGMHLQQLQRMSARGISVQEMMGKLSDVRLRTAQSMTQLQPLLECHENANRFLSLLGELTTMLGVINDDLKAAGQNYSPHQR